AESKEIVVPDDYLSIQEAIDNASDGDTILVRSGIYEGAQNKTLTIDKTISLLGEDAKNTKICLHPEFWTVTFPPDTRLSGCTDPLVIHADDVILSGFTITSDGGVIRVNGNNTQIVGNVINVKLHLQGRNQTFALNNITASVTCSGYYSYVYKNNVMDCSIGTLTGSYASIFANTVIRGSIGTGGTSNTAVIYNNTVKRGQIMLASNRNIVCNNSISNGNKGLGITWGGENLISKNVVSNCSIGLYKTQPQRGNVFSANQIENCSCGLKFEYYGPMPETKLYFNNFVNNAHQVNMSSSIVITWDDGVTGNYWSNYNGSDDNADGIGDIPFQINAKNQDPYPLIKQFDIYNLTIQLPEWAIIESETTVPKPIFPTSSNDCIPEFPSSMILPLILIITIVSIIIKRILISDGD
ncbi:MAG: hypothetical protein CW716_08990, partial [Candidatus Bathyarchaeum sp.]